MLIGQIEQEILEGRFWNFWLKAYPDYFNSQIPIDLQPDRQVGQNNPTGKRTLSNRLSDGRP